MHTHQRQAANRKLWGNRPKAERKTAGEKRMRDLNYELKQMCRRNRDGSFATQRDRERVLDLVANQLHELGYRHMAAASLKPKHVERLVQRWQAEGLAMGTIKNRMAELRWRTEKSANRTAARA